MATPKHTKETLFNGTCEKCSAKTHSCHEDFTYVNIGKPSDNLKITIEEQVCLSCGPTVTFHVPYPLIETVEDALYMAGYDLTDEGRTFLKEID